MPTVAGKLRPTEAASTSPSVPSEVLSRARLQDAAVARPRSSSRQCVCAATHLRTWPDPFYLHTPTRPAHRPRQLKVGRTHSVLCANNLSMHRLRLSLQVFAMGVNTLSSLDWQAIGLQGQFVCLSLAFPFVVAHDLLPAVMGTCAHARSCNTQSRTHMQTHSFTHMQQLQSKSHTRMHVVARRSHTHVVSLQRW